MIIKERAKVLKAHVAHQSAACLADFEKQIAAEYRFDDDEVWKAATEEAMKKFTGPGWSSRLPSPIVTPART